MKKLITAVLAALAQSAHAAGADCATLAQLSLPNTQIDEAAVIAKGAYPAPVGQNGQPQNPALYASLPAFCRVKATLRPSADSDIKVEVWLPQEGWNGRLQAVGNGAFSSTPQYGALAQALAAGYTGVATNTGKEGNSGDTLIGRPEKLKDWGYRAVHEMTVTAKAVITARYGSPAKYSYWNSCSTGGRQGLVAAEYFPEDFDGIADGDAANPMTRNQASTIFSTLAVNQEEAGFLSAAKWQAYRNAVMEKCDAIDGLKDGLLENPMACKFEPKEMLCKNGDNDSCLTAPQIAALSRVHAGMKNPRTGESLHPGWQVGAVPNTNMMVGRRPEQVAIDTFRVLFNNPDWDYKTMDFDKDIARADQLGRNLMDASDPTRLKAFLARGGKLMMYHGWSDTNISPLLGLDYYNKAVAANGGRAKTDNSIRMFMLPGLGHCGPYFDKMPPIVDWVENGKAPDRIVVNHAGPDGKVTRTRPACVWPQIAKYNGTGSIDEAANFSCAAQ